jgi:hypothetical protein
VKVEEGGGIVEFHEDRFLFVLTAMARGNV